MLTINKNNYALPISGWLIISPTLLYIYHCERLLSERSEFQPFHWVASRDANASTLLWEYDTENHTEKNVVTLKIERTKDMSKVENFQWDFKGFLNNNRRQN